MRVCARVLAAALMAGAIAVAVSFPAFIGGQDEPRGGLVAPPAAEQQTIRLPALRIAPRRRFTFAVSRAKVVENRPARLASAPLGPSLSSTLVIHKTASAPVRADPRPAPPAATPVPAPVAPAPATPAPAPPQDQSRELASTPPPPAAPAPPASDDESDDEDESDGDHGHGDHGHDQGHGHGHGQSDGDHGHGSNHDD